MKQFPIFMALTVLCFWAFAQSAKDAAVATIGTHKITVEEFNRRYADAKEKAINLPTKGEYLEALVRQEVGLQEAAKRGVEKNPKVQDMVKQALYAGFLELELGQKVQTTPVSDKEMQEYYKHNPEIRVSYILTELKPGATKEQRAEARGRAEKIYEEVKSSKRPFEELVRLYTDDSLTKSTGGDAGWQSRCTFITSF
jgi:parvulin-like peptidyl-prolyl isomerase